MYALADCNNFFASCERVFRPELNGRPVIVLSNNDGCAVARSNEAKALGIKMGDPYFKLKPLIEQHGIAVFSSNFALYGDMSRRVQEVLGSFAPAVEHYSIDEAFLDLSGMEGCRFRCLRPGDLPGLLETDFHPGLCRHRPDEDPREDRIEALQEIPETPGRLLHVPSGRHR